MSIWLILLVVTVNINNSLTLSCRTNKQSKCRWNSTCEYDVELCNQTLDGRRGGVYCVTLVNSIEQVIVEQMGCMYDQETTKKCQNQSQCLMKFTNAEKKFLHCCCDKDFCNFNLNLSDPTIRPSPSTPDSHEPQDLCSAGFLCRKLTVSIAVGLGFLLVSVVVLVSVLVYRRNSLKQVCSRFIRKKQDDASIINRANRQEQSESSLLLALNSAESVPSKSIEMNLIEISTNVVKTGRSSKVCTGIYQDKTVALKLFDSDSTSKSSSARSIFEHERDIYLLAQMEHSNIVKLFGYSMSESRFILVLEYADRGSVRDYLRSTTIETEEEIVEMLRQISSGVEFLHRDFRAEQSPISGSTRSPIAHRDLKTENILRRSDGRLLLCDFAMSIQLDEANLSKFDHQQIGTARYMSPEILSGTIGNDVNALLRCDVFSLGIVFWEIISRLRQLEGSSVYEMPYETQLAERNLKKNPTIDEMMQIISLDPPYNRPTIKPSWRNSSTINEILLTVEQCWQSMPEGRISASLVAHRIRTIKQV